MHTVHYSSASDEWETPQKLFADLDREFGFALDVCATKENTKCKVWYTEEQNALNRNWIATGPAWMNPPYGRQIGQWIAKAKGESGRGVTVVCLLPARTDTRWFHDHCWNIERDKPRTNVEVRFLKGRLKFGTAKAGAPFPSMVVIFTPPPGCRIDPRQTKMFETAETDNV